MPSASDEDRLEWGGAQGIGEDKAMGYLQDKGFVLNGWQWTKPSSGYLVTEDDWGAINFLIDEWDFGGLVDA